MNGGVPSSDGLPFETLSLADAPVVTAPDGSTVHVLPRVAGGSMAHFTLEPDQASSAVVHRSVEELWFVVGGSGEMWRRAGDRSSVVALAPGTALQPNGLKQLLRRLGTKTGLPKVHAHRFRHTFATWAIEHDARELDVQYLLGHSSPDMVRR